MASTRDLDQLRAVALTDIMQTLARQGPPLRRRPRASDVRRLAIETYSFWAAARDNTSAGDVLLLYAAVNRVADLFGTLEGGSAEARETGFFIEALIVDSGVTLEDRPGYVHAWLRHGGRPERLVVNRTDFRRLATPQGIPFDRKFFDGKAGIRDCLQTMRARLDEAISTTAVLSGRDVGTVEAATSYLRSHDAQWTADVLLDIETARAAAIGALPLILLGDWTQRADRCDAARLASSIIMETGGWAGINQYSLPMQTMVSDLVDGKEAGLN